MKIYQVELKFNELVSSRLISLFTYYSTYIRIDDSTTKAVDYYLGPKHTKSINGGFRIL